MSKGPIRIERDDGIARILLERPPANAIELTLAEELANALEKLAQDPEVGAVVLTGTGSCFCAGLDLKEVPSYSAEEQRTLIERANRMIARLYGCPLPTVAALNGHAVAGGLVLALACDVRIAVETGCRIGLSEARVGIPFPAAAMTVLQSELSPAAARRLTLATREIDPQTAVTWGVLDACVAPEALPQRATEAARDLAALPRSGYARIKLQLRGPALERVEGALERGADPLLQGWLAPGTPDAAAGARGTPASTKPSA